MAIMFVFPADSVLSYPISDCEIISPHYYSVVSYPMLFPIFNLGIFEATAGTIAGEARILPWIPPWGPWSLRPPPDGRGAGRLQKSAILVYPKMGKYNCC